VTRERATRFTGMCRESPVPHPEFPKAFGMREFGIGGDESAWNEISILIAGMLRPERFRDAREHHIWMLIRGRKNLNLFRRYPIRDNGWQ